MVEESSNPRLHSLALIAVVLLFALTGCVPASGTELNEVNLAVESQMWSYQEDRTRDCMLETGFEYVTRAAPAGSGQAVARSPYSLTLDQARRYGFGYVDAALLVAGAQASDPNSQYRASLGADQQLVYDHALEGDPRGESAGCRAIAQEDAFAEYSDDFQTVVGSSDSLLEVANDPRYVAFESAWAECMTQAGYPTSGFEDFHRTWVVKAAGVVAVSYDELGNQTQNVDSAAADAALNAEINAAVANVDCLAPLEDDFNKVIDDVLG